MNYRSSTQMEEVLKPMSQAFILYDLNGVRNDAIKIVENLWTKFGNEQSIDNLEENLVYWFLGSIGNAKAAAKYLTGGWEKYFPFVFPDISVEQNRTISYQISVLPSERRISLVLDSARHILQNFSPPHIKNHCDLLKRGYSNQAGIFQPEYLISIYQEKMQNRKHYLEYLQKACYYIQVNLGTGGAMLCRLLLENKYGRCLASCDEDEIAELFIKNVDPLAEIAAQVMVNFDKEGEHGTQPK